MLIREITVHPEPAGNGFQAYINGNNRWWGRGDTVPEAIGNAVAGHVRLDLSGLAEQRQLAMQELGV